MATGAVLSASETSTQMSDTVQNPVGTANRQIVHVTLVFEGVNFDPAALYSALDAAYGTVASERNRPSRGSYVFNISS